MKPFVGFGETAPSFSDELTPYLTTPSYDLREPLCEWVSGFENRFMGELKNRAFVTQLQMEATKIISARINGNDTIKAHQFADGLRKLNTITNNQVFTAKNLQKIAKAKFWSGITIHLFSEEKSL